MPTKKEKVTNSENYYGETINGAYIFTKNPRDNLKGLYNKTRTGAIIVPNHSEEIQESSEKSERGKKSRAKGQRFEAKVRLDLENLGWTVAKWPNTVDFEKNKVAPAKRKYNPFLKALSVGTGFPDFVCFRRSAEEGYEVIGLEVKGNGYLDAAERGMCIWLLQNKVFSRILIAKKSEEKPGVEYLDFDVKYNKK